MTICKWNRCYESIVKSDGKIIIETSSHVDEDDLTSSLTCQVIFFKRQIIVKCIGFRRICVIVIAGVMRARNIYGVSLIAYRN